MQICRDLPSLRAASAALHAGGKRLALVPTMGALHDGHIALVTAGRAAADAVATSIFVNPLQFNPNEDLSRYPRDEEGDLDKLRRAGCDLVWMPPVEAMYPPGSATVIEVAGPTAGWEGDARPGHFRGVATVCCKLFLQSQADVAVFGEKDWQQLQVVTRMAADLDIPTRILPVETVREVDGLAMSSRNRFLSSQDRETAPVLLRVMTQAAAAIATGGTVEAALQDGLATLRGHGFAPDYLALVEAETLKPLAARRTAGPMRLIAAARLGTVRLLDNIAVG
ncbi:pantoate--beta-alanine ligase [Roseomonas terrae]|jgi:pantoate--beta-alanine ligase|uniref:Pantothenate synthetase n=1 Tax=Neoroseomonas terrae TaxID=424799 RepID=A0ABS5EJD9_9PROT|nr:pantoate--beta-alanine ligase [Neoroseomonas terrae]MBR0651141.1 pantoate--beta-alanine ligase [Neoroseomonas terrae]